MPADVAIEVKDPSRTRAGWLLALPFLWFASPVPLLLALGAIVALLGVATRAWAAGTIRKGHVLATLGPYARVRNPLYLGQSVDRPGRDDRGRPLGVARHVSGVLRTDV